VANLLDQPEDDLDNRSVYDDLVGFLKNKNCKDRLLLLLIILTLLLVRMRKRLLYPTNPGKRSGVIIKNSDLSMFPELLRIHLNLLSHKESAVLLRKGIRDNTVCEILEGGPEAFQNENKKYSFSK
jgi:hypothetical protein